MTAPVAFPNEVHLPRGFAFSALAAGIKISGKPDLGLVDTDPATRAAAVFTRNRVVAAPLEVGKSFLRRTGGRVRAVIVNAGNANCATGQPGIRNCEQVCNETARLLGIDRAEVFPSSTGIIGVPLPVEKITRKLPELVATCQASGEALFHFAEAIMTTDTRRKVASEQIAIGKNVVNIAGVAKGSGMIHPQLATMLVYLFTDLSAASGQLRPLLKDACEETFNCLSIDGDTSTNDTVLLLASGQSGVRLSAPGCRTKFAKALHSVCQSLGEQIVSDGEGVQHVIRLRIDGAKDHEEAKRVAKAIAHSLLVKTAWAGADPNWGRILAAVGACGVPVDPRKIDIGIGSQTVFRNGALHAFNEQQAHQALSQPACDVRVNLRRGRNSLLFLTTDLTAEYVHINAEYST